MLRSGGLVVFPTDTVYGVGADPYNSAAVRRIYRIKGRAESKPLQLLLADASQIAQVAAELPEAAGEVVRRFFPGGITLVLKRHASLPLRVVAGGATVGVRVPDHPWCQALLRAFGAPLAATSANRSGEPSPKTAQEAAAQLGGKVDLILDGGPCPLGQESTVLDLSGPRPQLLRSGAVARADIERVLGMTVALGSS